MAEQAYKLLIGGNLVDGDSTMDVINPATEAVFTQAPRASEAQLNDAVAAAKAAFPAWAATPIDERRKVITAIADAVEANYEDFARLLTQEQGKPLQDATGEVLGTVAFMRYFAGLDMPVKVLDDSEGRRVEAHRKPLGVIGAIVPWNFPMILMAFKLPPALLAGNTVVLKPAPTTPLASLRFAELVKDILPKGVLNLVMGRGSTVGQALLEHKDVHAISFTGSVSTGRKVAEQAGHALVLHRTLRALAAGELTLERARSAIDAEPEVRLDYFVTVDPGDLSLVEPGPGTLALVAAWVGPTRLIDNMRI